MFGRAKVEYRKFVCESNCNRYRLWRLSYEYIIRINLFI